MKDISLSYHYLFHIKASLSRKSKGSQIFCFFTLLPPPEVWLKCAWLHCLTNQSWWILLQLGRHHCYICYSCFFTQKKKKKNVLSTRRTTIILATDLRRCNNDQGKVLLPHNWVTSPIALSHLILPPRPCSWTLQTRRYCTLESNKKFLRTQYISCSARHNGSSDIYRCGYSS